MTNDPKYLWNSESGHLFLAESNTRVLNNETAPKFESLDEARQYLHDHQMSGTVGRLVN